MRPSNINRQEKAREERESRLFEAIADDDITKVKSLLAQKVNPNSVIDDNTTHLFVDSQENNSAIVKALLKAKADPDIPIDDGATPLYIAAEQNHLNIIRILLNANANPNLAMKDGKTPLYIASNHNSFGIVKALLEAKADPDLQIDDGATPLYIAVEKGNLDVVKALLEAKANPDLAMKDGDTPISEAARIGNLDIFKALLEAKADPTIVNVNGFDALVFASDRGHLSIVKLLIEYEKKNSIEDFSLALILASGNGHLEIVKVLLEAGADVNSIPNLPDVASPLYLATQNGHLETVKTLLENGADVDSLYPKTNSAPLFIATQQGYLEIVRTLLENGADVNLVYPETNSSPLNAASEKGHLEIVNLLLAQENIDINIKDIYGDTSLDIASTEGHLEIVKALLAKKGQDWNIPQAMSFAFRSNQFDILEEFYKKIDSEVSSASCLLHFQIYLLGKNSDEDKLNKSLEILFNFLSEDRKIELLTQQNNGKTILDYVIENNNYSVASLIYNKSINLIYKDDAECQAMKSTILIKALKNYSNETEFFEFFKLVNGNEKLLPEREIEIQRLKLLESQEDQIKIDNALAEIKKTQEKHLTEVWKFFKDDDLDGFKSLIAKDPTKIISFRYNEDQGDETHSKKTFLHRLVEHDNEKSKKFLTVAILALRRLEKTGETVPELDLSCEVQYRDFTTKINKGEVRGVTPLYLAISKINLNAVKYLIPYSNLNAPITKENFSTGAIKEYSLFELALEKANFDSSNPTLAPSDSKNSFEILEMITKEGDQKARFPESAEQLEKIARNYEKYKPKIKNLLAERYPVEINEIKKLAKKYKDTESSSTEESGAGFGIQLRARGGVSLQSSISDLHSRFKGLSLGGARGV